MIKRLYEMTCEDCGAVAHVRADTLEQAITKARGKGWAVGRDKKRCYCQDHAPAHRYDASRDR